MNILKIALIFISIKNIFSTGQVFNQFKQSNLINKIKIGAIMTDFESKKRTSEKATIDYAIRKLNQEYGKQHNVEFEVKLITIPTEDSFKALKFVCNGLLKDGVIAIINLDDKNSVPALKIKEQADIVKIPYINSYWDKYSFLDTDDHYFEYTINSHPNWRKISLALVDLINYTGWEKFVLIYEDSETFDRLSYLAEFFLNKDMIAFVRLPKNPDLWKPFLRKINYNKVKKFLVDVKTGNLNDFLENSLQVGLLSRDKEFIFTNLDLSIINMEKYIWLDVNLTSFQIVDVRSPLIKQMVKDWMVNEFKGLKSPLENEKTFKTNCGLIYDGIFLIADTVIKTKQKYPFLNSMSLDCSETNDNWPSGAFFIQELKANRLNISTGSFLLENHGKRNNFKLNLISLNKNGLETVGEWSTDLGLSVHKTIGFENPEFIANKHVLNRTLVVTVVLEKPYVSLKRDWESYDGNDRFEGFCIDILVAIAEICQFNFTIYQVPSNIYGSQNDKGEWNGMVRELIDNKADLALASLTINLARAKVIDLTKPFLNLGLSILFKRPEPKAPGLFSFLSPLSTNIWLYMLASYFATSLVMFINSRFSPFEWSKLNYCNAPKDRRRNQFTLNSAFWYVVTSFIHMGIDINPHAPSTRLLNWCWSLFTLIITASYTANLAAFLTVKRVEMPINSAEDLSLQSEIGYGCLGGGSSETFFRESKIPTYERMWNFMKSNPNMMVKSTQEGINRVKQGNYAFLLESTTNEYARQRDCELMQVGDLLDSKSYGLGLRKGLELREEISNAVLLLQEKGKIQQAYDKWWKMIGAINCDASSKKADSEGDAMNFQNIRGIFVVLIVGIIISCIVAIIEYIWKVKKSPESNKISDECKKSIKSFKLSKICECFSMGNSKTKITKDVSKEKDLNQVKNLKIENKSSNLNGSKNQMNYLLKIDILDKTDDKTNNLKLLDSKV